MRNALNFDHIPASDVSQSFFLFCYYSAQWDFEVIKKKKINLSNRP
jgi:hypothetical protein